MFTQERLVRMWRTDIRLRPNRIGVHVPSTAAVVSLMDNAARRQPGRSWRVEYLVMLAWTPLPGSGEQARLQADPMPWHGLPALLTNHVVAFHRLASVRQRPGDVMGGTVRPPGGATDLDHQGLYARPIVGDVDNLAVRAMRQREASSNAHLQRDMMGDDPRIDRREGSEQNVAILPLYPGLGRIAEAALVEAKRPVRRQRRGACQHRIEG